MTEDEAVDCSAFDAEAALVVLAEPLAWYHPTGNPNSFGARSGQAAYVYSYAPKEQLFYVCYSPDVKNYTKGPPDRPYRESLTYRYYGSAAEAKAACEIHAATGKFPPGVEVEVSGPILRTQLQQGRE